MYLYEYKLNKKKKIFEKKRINNPYFCTLKSLSIWELHMVR